jgi:hypothetical protein
MSELSRRSFLVSIAALPVVVPHAAHAALLQTSLDEPLLRSVAEALLPSELTPNDRAAVVSDFLRWTRDYRPGAERNHAYGSAELGTLPGDPVPAWGTQLRALEAEARQNHNTGFAALPVATRRTMIAAQLGEERNLPNPLSARHVALALLAHFYASARAADLCYRAQIGKETCRPLAAASAQPAALRRS